MPPLSRRRTLHLAGLGIGTALAGCLSRSGPDDGSGGDDPDGGDGNETDGDDGDDDETGIELRSHDSIQFAVTGSRPDWFEEMGTTVGDVTVIDSAERADVVWPHDDVDPDRREDVADFLEDASFEESVLLFVESVGPNTCHDSIAFEDVVLEDGRLAATASVVDSSGTNEACGEAITYPSALLRATYTGKPITEATVTVVDGWDNETTVTASAEDPLSVSPNPDELSGYVKPDGDPNHVPEALECDDEGADRLQNWVAEDDIAWGETDGGDLALRVDQRSVEPGETVQISTTNVTDERLYTGNRHKHSLEVYTEEGWMDVRIATDERALEHTDEAIGHDPGDGFEWTFELTETGVVDDHVHADSLEVCPGLPDGRYRFVFWEPAIAVAFDLTA